MKKFTYFFCTARICSCHFKSSFTVNPKKFTLWEFAHKYSFGIRNSSFLCLFPLFEIKDKILVLEQFRLRPGLIQLIVMHSFASLTFLVSYGLRDPNDEHKKMNILYKLNRMIYLQGSKKVFPCVFT
jgi:hypothetical protein